MIVLCVPCDERMLFQSGEGPEQGSLLAVAFSCPSCGKRVGLLTNPAESQLATSIGYKIGGRETPARPMEMVQGALSRSREVGTSEGEPVWTEAAERRLAAAPAFVQGMVRALYNDYAVQKGYSEITPAVMTEAKEQLGMTDL